MAEVPAPMFGRGRVRAIDVVNRDSTIYFRAGFAAILLCAPFL